MEIGTHMLDRIYLLFPIADANNPPNAPARLVEAKKKVKRFWASLLLYHIPSR